MSILTDVIQISTNLSHRPAIQKTKQREVSRLISAAVINQGFRNLLLADPGSALQTGFNGEAFSLGTEDQEAILSIQAGSLPEFAMQIADHH